MTNEEIINKICEAIFENGFKLAKEKVNPICRNKFGKELKKVLLNYCAEIFLSLGLTKNEPAKLIKKELKNILGIIFQPSDEEIYFDRINKPDSIFQRIYINLTHGWGAKVDDEILVEMFYLIDNSENPWEIGLNLYFGIRNKFEESRRALFC